MDIQLEKILVQSLTASERATTTLDLDELINVPSASPKGFYLVLGDGATVGGLDLLISKSQVVDLSLIASEIDISPDISAFGADKTVHNALDVLGTHMNDSTKHFLINDSSEAASVVWSASKIRAEFNTINAEIGSSIHAPVQDITALKAIDTTSMSDKVLILVEDNGQYRFDLQSTATEDIDDIVQPTTGSGRWIKMSSTTIHDAVTIASGSADYLSLTTSTQELNFSTAKFSDASLDVDFNSAKVNGSDLLTGITKAMIEAQLTGAITSHTHAYLSSVAMTDISDTTISGLADDDFLVYDSGTSKWKNQVVTVSCKGGARTV